MQPHLLTKYDAMVANTTTQQFQVCDSRPGDAFRGKQEGQMNFVLAFALGSQLFWMYLMYNYSGGYLHIGTAFLLYVLKISDTSKRDNEMLHLTFLSRNRHMVYFSQNHGYKIYVWNDNNFLINCVFDKRVVNTFLMS